MRTEERVAAAARAGKVKMKGVAVAAGERKSLTTSPAADKSAGSFMNITRFIRAYGGYSAALPGKSLKRRG